MNCRQVIRTRYFAKAVMWGIIALIFAVPAIKYLGEYGRYIQGGINEFLK